jgi:hypothetical protein
MAKGTDVVALSDVVKDYPALRGDPTVSLAVLRENMGGEKLTEFDLDRVKMPAGGGKFWEVPTMDGDKAEPVLEGVVVITKNVRAYWPRSVDEGDGNEPPQCSSPDAIHGVGDPGIACDECPYSRFGSSTKEGSKGQACKQMRQLFLISERSVLPLVLTLPPTSLAAARKYFMRLASHSGIYYWATTTKIALEQADGPAGKYSVATFSQGNPLAEADVAAITKYREALEPIIAARLPDAADAGSYQ